MRSVASAEVVRAIVAACAVFFVMLSASDARAYAWMIRHSYTGCATCHLDPSGSATLTPYGRAIGDLVLRTRYGDKAQESGEPGPEAGFLWGILPMPDALMPGGDVRLIGIVSKVDSAPVDDRVFFMQADFELGVRLGGFLANGSLGYAEDGGFGAALTRAPEQNLVSRQHWIGYELDSISGFTVRAGRMQVPYGIRQVEHTLWVRSLTDTEVNDDQQYGFSIAWAPEPIRAELMLIAGNYQLRPDAYRERGYSVHTEWMATNRLALGLSHLVTHRDLDPTFLREAWRQQGGVSARWATDWEPLVVLAEADYVFRSPKQDERREGAIASVQADIEPIQGVHAIGTGELHNVGINGPPASWGVWLSGHWFFLPHADVRVDTIYRRLGNDQGSIDSYTLLLQGHVYL